MWQRFAQDDRCATAIEYGLIAALIAVAVIGTVALTGNQLANTFGMVAFSLEQSGGGQYVLEGPPVGP